MADNFYSSMYGPRPTRPDTPKKKPELPKGPAPANKRLSGLKLTGSHMHEIELADGTIGTIPTAAYVKLLEDQIKAFRSMVNQQADDLRRTNRSIQALNREINKIRAELDKTVKLR